MFLHMFLMRNIGMIKRGFYILAEKFFRAPKQQQGIPWVFPLPPYIAKKKLTAN